MEILEPMSRSSNLINANDCFLLIIDVQVFFMRGLTKEEQRVFIRKYQHLIKLSQVLNIPLIITTENIKKNGALPDILLNSIPPSAQIYDKWIYSCWGQKNIREAIKNTHKRVAVICGFETDVCVTQTAIDLLENGYRVVALTDIIYSRNNIEHEIGLKRMERHGVILAVLKSWQEEITAGVRTSIHQILKESRLMDI